MAQKLILPITEEDIRKELSRKNIREVSIQTDIHETILYKYRANQAGMHASNILKLINYLYK